MKQKPLILIFFSFFIFHFSLWADVGVGTPRPTDALPPLVKDGEPLRQIDKTSLYMENRSRINAIALSSDGKSIISGSYDNSIKIWNRATGELEKEFWGGVNGCWQVIVLNSSPPKKF